MALAALDLSSALAAMKPKPVSIKVPHRPSAVGDFTISFHPREPLPSGGYYYAVVVLAKRYAMHLSSVRCAKSSNMEITEYNYPKSGQPVDLTLSPEESGLTPGKLSPLDWCSGAIYTGAVYAVPHGPPCRRSAPCFGNSTAPECYEGEQLCSGGKQVFGTVRRDRYRPGELPEPRDSSTRVIAHFRVAFQSADVMGARALRSYRERSSPLSEQLAKQDPRARAWLVHSTSGAGRAQPAGGV